MTIFRLEPKDAPKMPPVRVVFESAARGMNIEKVVPCALLVFPDESTPGVYNLFEQHGPPAELAQMCEIILRFAIANGLADLIFRGLVAGPTKASAVTRDVNPIPPDDQPTDAPRGPVS